MSFRYDPALDRWAVVRDVTNTVVARLWYTTQTLKIQPLADNGAPCLTIKHTKMLPSKVYSLVASWFKQMYPSDARCTVTRDAGYACAVGPPPFTLPINLPLLPCRPKETLSSNLKLIYRFCAHQQFILRDGYLVLWSDVSACTPAPHVASPASLIHDFAGSQLWCFFAEPDVLKRPPFGTYTRYRNRVGCVVFVGTYPLPLPSPLDPTAQSYGQSARRLQLVSAPILRVVQFVDRLRGYAVCCCAELFGPAVASISVNLLHLLMAQKALDATKTGGGGSLAPPTATRSIGSSPAFNFSDSVAAATRGVVKPVCGVPRPAGAPVERAAGM